MFSAVPTSCSQQNPGIILLSNNGQTTPTTTTTTPNNVLTSHAMQGIVQAPPMIVILPGNNQNAAPAVQAPVVQTNVQQSGRYYLRTELFSYQFKIIIKNRLGDNVSDFKEEGY